MQNVVESPDFKASLQNVCKLLTTQDKKTMRRRLENFNSSYSESGLSSTVKEIYRLHGTPFYIHTLFKNPNNHIIIVFTESSKQLVLSAIGEYTVLIETIKRISA